MSNDNTVDSAVEAPIAETIGQAEVSTEIGEAPEVAKDYFSWDEYADRNVKLNVAGEEVDVPLKEALAGYQRQADYTRKTQELSEQRRQVQFGGALQEALQNDPKGTLELLKQHYGLDETPLTPEEEELQDPVEKQYRQLEQRVQAFEHQKAADELERTVASLQAKYEDFDANEVVSRALALGSTNLEAVYKQISFDNVYEDAKAIREIRSKAASDEQVRTSAKRQAGVVSGGTTSSSADVSAKPITSLREAFEAAKRQHS